MKSSAAATLLHGLGKLLEAPRNFLPIPGLQRTSVICPSRAPLHCRVLVLPICVLPIAATGSKCCSGAHLMQAQVNYPCTTAQQVYLLKENSKL